MCRKLGFMANWRRWQKEGTKLDVSKEAPEEGLFPPCSPLRPGAAWWAPCSREGCRSGCSWSGCDGGTVYGRPRTLHRSRRSGPPEPASWSRRTSKKTSSVSKTSRLRARGLYSSDSLCGTQTPPELNVLCSNLWTWSCLWTGTEDTWGFSEFQTFMELNVKLTCSGLAVDKEFKKCCWSMSPEGTNGTSRDILDM